MSKLIVEMKLPCKIYYLGGLHGTPTCPIERRICKDQKNPPSWCPIKGELPEQHGDLIDRDALLETCIYYDINPNKSAVDADNIQDMPVIIAAERKDE